MVKKKIHIYTCIYKQMKIYSASFLGKSKCAIKANTSHLQCHKKECLTVFNLVFSFQINNYIVVIWRWSNAKDWRSPDSPFSKSYRRQCSSPESCFSFKNY